MTEFVKGQAVLVQRDLNQDGAFDLLVRMVKGTPIVKEEDRNHDGRMDRFTAYDDQGRPLSVREFATDPKETDLKKPVKITRFKHGELCSVTQIDNGKTVITRFLNDKPVRQTIDEDRDGQPEQTAPLATPTATVAATFGNITAAALFIARSRIGTMTKRWTPNRSMTPAGWCA